MGYMVHHTIVVSSWNEKLLIEAHEKATTMFDGLVSEIVASHTNGYLSFFIAPDGSKEGWGTSDDFNRRRDEIVSWMREQVYSDGSTSLAWVEVQFADDGKNTKVVRDSDHA